MEKFDLIVIGGGPGGYVAAIAAATYPPGPAPTTITSKLLSIINFLEI